VTDSGQRPISDRLRWDDDLTKARSNPEFLRSPIRLAFAIGAGIMFVGAMLPWAEGMVGLLPVQFGGFDGAADGLILAGFAIVGLLFARSPDFLNAVDGARRWAPLLLGLGCLGIWLLGWQAGQMRIAGWEDDDGHGSMALGYWVAGVGAIIVAVAGSYATLRYHEGQTSNPLAFLRLPRRSDAVTLGAWMGGLAGGWLGVSAALAIFPPVAASAPMLFMGSIGLIVGAYAGRAVGRIVRGG
jgi:hypothetical protein